MLLVGTFVGGNFLIAHDRAVTRDMLGHDFLAFYTGGTFARLGHHELLYNLEAVRHFEHATARANNLSISDGFGPFWNPPFYAWVFAPLSALPYPQALAAWITINVLALGGALVMLVRMLPGQRDWRAWLLVPVLVCTSMPFVQALSHAQNTFTSLLLLCGVVTAWRARRDVFAGLVCGLMFYKPQLAAVIAVMLVLDRGPRVCLGLSFTIGSLLIATALTMPDALGDYLHRLPENVRFMQVENEYLWERHATLKAMFRLLIQGRAAGESSLLVTALTTITCALVWAGLLVSVWRTRRAPVDDPFTGETRALRRDRLIAATIACMPLVMPFYFDYDLLLLAVPAVLFAGEMMMRAPGLTMQGHDKLLLGTWTALYAWTMINPGLARASGVNVSVLLLAAVAALLVRRGARKPIPAEVVVDKVYVARVPALRAA